MYKYIQASSVDKYDIKMLSQGSAVFVLYGVEYEEVISKLQKTAPCIKIDCAKSEQEITAQIIANKNTAAPLLIDKSRYDNASLFLYITRSRKAPLILYNNTQYIPKKIKI